MNPDEWSRRVDTRGDGSTPPPAQSNDADEPLSPWAAIVGPCYTVASFGRTVGVSEAAVLDAATERRVLRLMAADGVDLFPVFQVRDGHVHPQLHSVLEVLRSGVDDPWTWAQWLNTPLDDDITQIEHLWAGHLSEVLRDARHDARAWNS